MPLGVPSGSCESARAERPRSLRGVRRRHHGFSRRRADWRGGRIHPGWRRQAHAVRRCGSFASAGAPRSDAFRQRTYPTDLATGYEFRAILIRCSDADGADGVNASTRANAARGGAGVSSVGRSGTTRDQRQTYTAAICASHPTEHATASAAATQCSCGIHASPGGGTIGAATGTVS